MLGIHRILMHGDEPDARWTVPHPDPVGRHDAVAQLDQL